MANTREIFTAIYFEFDNQQMIRAGEIKFGLEIGHEHTYAVCMKCCL
jgi:hypothetical protein